MSQNSSDTLSSVRDRVLASMIELPESIDRYRIRGELGRGGMGIVYDAYDPRLDRAVAIKVIHPQMAEGEAEPATIERFEREMRAAGQISHPNVVSILDAGVAPLHSEPRRFYVMERVTGPSLEERLRDAGQLPRAETLQIGMAISRGLAALHSAGLVHRDLKPSNILLPLDAPPKISDFGLCSATGGSSEEEDSGAGTARYMAPEQIQRLGVSPATDLFALGAILMRMATGRDPFPARSTGSRFYRVLHDAPDGLTALDPDLARIVGRMLSKDPQTRPASASAVAAELQALPIHEPRPWLRRRRARPSRPRPGIAWIVATAVAALIGGAGVTMHNDLVALERDLDTRWKQVENQLARQAELIPQLIEVTERYLSYESDARGQWIEAMASSAPRAGSADPVGAQRALLATLALARSVPELRGDRQFRALSHEIAGTKNRITVERARYNEAVGRFNRRLQQFPWSLLSGRRPLRAFFDPPAAHLEDPGLGSGS